MSGSGQGAPRAGTVTEVTHPLVKHKITLVRDVQTDTHDFRELVNELAGLVCYAATEDLPMHEVEVDTPLERTIGHQVSGKKVAVVPVLRAGLGMLDGVTQFLPVARIGFIGLYRDEETLEPKTYYSKLPDDMDQRIALVLDPMLATGGSVSRAIDLVKESGCTQVKLLAVLGAPEGIAHLHEQHPDVDIYVAHIDERLDENGYIRPGLGDAGDRLFGTR